MQSSNELAYDDFDIEIGQGKGQEYPVAVLHSEAGEAHEIMHFPYDQLMLENRLLALKTALIESGGSPRRSPSPEQKTVQDFGSDLFNALITGEIRNRYDVSMEKAQFNGKGLRIRLRIQSANLAMLPWEFLYEPRQKEYMSLMRSISIVRYPEHPQPIQPLNVKLPLRILGMAVSLEDQTELEINNEKQRINEALKNLQDNGIVELTWLSGQTWRDLAKAMRTGPWNIFHFIGHGGFDQGRNEGYIDLAKEGGGIHRISANDLKKLLADHHDLRLVILNSCEGARGCERDLNSSTAAILAQRGVPAVLAMQYKITDRAAIEFARTFYEALADGLPVDAAVGESRKAISIEVANTVEWGTPVLYMRSPDGALFTIEKPELSEIYSKGLEAAKAQDWQTAINQFKKVLSIDASYRDASAKLKEAQQQQARQAELSELYSNGTEALAVKDWQTAIRQFKEILAIDGAYRDASVKLGEAEQQQARLTELSELYSKGADALKEHDWSTAINQFKQVLAIDARYRDAGTKLKEAKQQESIQAKLSALYSNGKEAFAVKDYQTAIRQFKEILAIDTAYRDTSVKLEEAEQQLEKKRKDLIRSLKKAVGLVAIIFLAIFIVFFFYQYMKPTLSVSPQPLFFDFGEMQTGDEVSRTVSISNSGWLAMNWRINSDKPWVIILPNNGTNSGSANITVNATGLNTGYYLENISVKSNGGDIPGNVSFFIKLPEITNPTGMVFVQIPAGGFDMGSLPEEEGRYPVEGPRHHVEIEYPFYIGKYEVTRDQWLKIIKTDPSISSILAYDLSSPDTDKLPVEGVSWDDARNFISKLNKEEGTSKYRLPSEAEWEYAARAGTKSSFFSGDDKSTLKDYAWFNDNSQGKPHFAGKRRPNPWGLYDVHGNVWEWVQDDWHYDYNNATFNGSAWITRNSITKVIRGGSFNNLAEHSRCAFRLPENRTERSGDFGFRVVRDI
jgi:formylglycine-generating enzyme required for sulfatase activity/outer membrane protein assembly factor BamD (BamD/ComL family)